MDSRDDRLQGKLGQVDNLATWIYSARTGSRYLKTNN